MMIVQDDEDCKDDMDLKNEKKMLNMMTAMSVVKSLHQSFVRHKLRLNFISMRKIFICYDTFIAQGNH